MFENRPRKQCGAVGRAPEEESGEGLALISLGKPLHLPTFVQNRTILPTRPNSELHGVLPAMLSHHPVYELLHILRGPAPCHLFCEAFSDDLLSLGPDVLLCASLVFRTPLPLDYLFYYGPWSRCHVLHRLVSWTDYKASAPT